MATSRVTAPPSWVSQPETGNPVAGKADGRTQSLKHVLISSCRWIRPLLRSRKSTCASLYLVMTSTNFRERTECCGDNVECMSPQEVRDGKVRNFPCLARQPSLQHLWTLNQKTRVKTRLFGLLTHLGESVDFPKHVLSICLSALLTAYGNWEAKGGLCESQSPASTRTSSILQPLPLACFLMLPDSLPTSNNCQRSLSSYHN